MIDFARPELMEGYLWSNCCTFLLDSLVDFQDYSYRQSVQREPEVDISNGASSVNQLHSRDYLLPGASIKVSNWDYIEYIGNVYGVILYTCFDC
jgi:hypothetical protein